MSGPAGPGARPGRAGPDGRSPARRLGADGGSPARRSGTDGRSAATAGPAPDPDSDPAPNLASALRPLAVHAAGSRALLADYPDTAAVLAAASAVRAAPPPGLVDLVPAERTLLLGLADPLDVPAARTALETLRPAPRAAEAAVRTVDIPVVYDGEDLAQLAELLDRTPEAVIAAHTGHAWTAAFGGFAPGFAYLLPEGEGLGEVPRRAEPRRRVPAGSVALAARYSGVYPRPSPGGWQLIGRTDAPLWTPEREGSPALLAPGTRVRFRAVRSLARVLPVAPRLGIAVPRGRATAPAEAAPAATSAASATPATALEALRVLDPGPQLLVEDSGRPGRAALGVGRSGAADRAALVRANLAVGNPPGSGALELLLGPASLVALRPVVLALAGAMGEAVVHRAALSSGPLPVLPVPAEAAVALDPGDRLEIGPARRGLRILLAVRGGVLAPGGAVLGSQARDTLSGLGPAPLAAGDVITVAAPSGLDAVPAPHRTDSTPATDGPEGVVLPLVLGPRDELLGTEAVAALLEGDWRVRPDSDRVGVRLDGDTLPLPAGTGTLPSEAIVPGAVQVPPSGLPVVFGRDHPATGGYPVIAVVEEAGLDLLAQAAPGTTVRFTAV